MIHLITFYELLKDWLDIPSFDHNIIICFYFTVTLPIFSDASYKAEFRTLCVIPDAKPPTMVN